MPPRAEALNKVWSQVEARDQYAYTAFTTLVAIKAIPVTDATIEIQSVYTKQRLRCQDAIPAWV